MLNQIALPGKVLVTHFAGKSLCLDVREVVLVKAPSPLSSKLLATDTTEKNWTLLLFLQFLVKLVVDLVSSAATGILESLLTLVALKHKFIAVNCLLMRLKCVLCLECLFTQLAGEEINMTSHIFLVVVVVDVTGAGASSGSFGSVVDPQPM